MQLFKVLGTLRAHFKPAMFMNTKEPGVIKKVNFAFSAESWLWQFNFVLWLTNWLCRVQMWGRACACHPEGGEGSEDCFWKGRRLKDAHEYVKAALKDGLEEANSWHTEFFNCSEEELAELQCCVRGGFDLAKMKFVYLEQLPYFMVHILKPGVKEMCRAAWNSCPPEKRHPLTRH